MSVLVALDTSETRLELLASAQALAAAAGWPLRIVHVRSEGGGKLKLPAKLRADADVSELEGAAAEQILRAAAAQDVKVLAFALRDGDQDGIGSVAGSLLLNDPHPLFVLRPGMRAVTSMKRLLVPLEGSPSSSEAMRQADDAFCKRGREIVMLHVVTSGTPLEAGSMPAPRMVDQEHYEWAAWQEEFCMRFAQCPEGGRHRVAVRVGDPTELIPKEARTLDAEMIVLSWTRSLEAGRSVQVRSLFDTSPCPLLLIPSAA
jgi:nucleotide-binding universal stress UspA family protein